MREMGNWREYQSEKLFAEIGYQKLHYMSESRIFADDTDFADFILGIRICRIKGLPR